MNTPVGAIVTHSAGRLRYPKLLAVTAVVFVADLLIPDLIPFVDEILLGLVTLLLSRLRIRKEPDMPL